MAHWGGAESPTPQAALSRSHALWFHAPEGALGAQEAEGDARGAAGCPAAARAESPPPSPGSTLPVPRRSCTVRGQVCQLTGR